MMILLTLLWLSTAFYGWMVLHMNDAGKFGPLHGNSINVVLGGGGDSVDHPSKLIAINNAGSVQIIKILANDPKKSQILVLVNLATSGFPDAMHANIELQDAGDHVEMTILSTVWNLPFQRVQQTITLTKDGNGGLKGP